MKHNLPKSIAGPLPRRDLVAILAYINCNRSGLRSLDGCVEQVQSRLDQLAAAARMQ